VLAKAWFVLLVVTIVRALSTDYWRHNLRHFLAGLIGLCLPQLTFGAEALRAFNIPTGLAERSLKDFAEQSGLEVLFATNTGGAIRTNTVKGSFTPREALDRLLLHTGLVAVQPEPGGPMTITRAPDAGKPPASRPSSSTPRAPADPLSPLPNQPVTLNPASKPMQKKHLAALLLSWFIPGAIPADTSSQAASVTGQVSNAATQVYLEGALITVRGTGRTAMTDRYGRYDLPGLPPQPATLVVSYMGLTPQEITVSLMPGQRLVRDVSLTSDIYVMDRYDVISIREGQAAAITAQKLAPNVKNVAATDAFGDVADGNIGEFARRLPGVSAHISQGEAVRVFIRGLDPNLNAVTFDGMAVPSGGSGNNRQTNISEYPIGGIESIEVTKSPTPDMDGDSIGGSVNLKPKTAFDRVVPRLITYSLAGNGRPNSPRSKWSPSASFGYSDLLGAAGNFGFSLNLSHSGNFVTQDYVAQTRQTIATDPAYLQQFRILDSTTERVRSGASLRLDYKLGERSRFYVNSFYSHYRLNRPLTRDWFITALNQVATLDSNGRPIPFQTQFPYGTPNYVPGGFNAAGTRVRASIIPGYTNDVTEMVNSTVRLTDTSTLAITRTYSVQPGGRHKFESVDLDYYVTYSNSTNRLGSMLPRNQRIGAVDVSIANTEWRIDSTKSNNHPEVTQTGGANYYDPATWTFAPFNYTQTNNRGTEIVGGELNLTQRFSPGLPAYVKTGLKYRSQERHTATPGTRFTFVGPRSVLPQFLDRNYNYNPIKGRYPMPPRFDLHAINAIHASNPEYFAEDLPFKVQRDFNYKVAKEEVTAGYLLGGVKLGSLSALGGVRVERTDLSGNSSIQDPRAGLNLTDPLERIRAQFSGRASLKRDYLNVLPGIHFKYEPVQNWIARLSYAASMARPSFGTIFPDTVLNHDTQRVNQNNPGLKPQTSDNFDLSIERYFEPVGVISAGVFLKEIKGFLYSTTRAIAPGTDNGFDGDYAGWTLATQANGGFARVRGAELNYSQQLSFLPGWLRGFGIYANYTWVETFGNYGDINQPARSELAQFRPRVFSGGLSFSHGRFSGRLHVNEMGSYLDAYNANPLLSVYHYKRRLVDVNLEYRFARRHGLFCDVQNVFNSPWHTYRAFPHRPAVHEDNGVRISFGVKGRF